MNKHKKSLLEYHTDILKSPEMLSTKQHIQHGQISVYAHCCVVALLCYKIAVRLKFFNQHSLVRGALLHDFFLYDWHEKQLSNLHGFRHPLTAYNNVCKHFEINELEADIIKKHMWPLTLFKIPRYRESWLVCMADKVCSALETLKIIKYDNETVDRLLSEQYVYAETLGNNEYKNTSLRRTKKNENF